MPTVETHPRFNLYFIFEEDKQKHPLPKDKAESLWLKIKEAIPPPQVPP